MYSTNQLRSIYPAPKSTDQVDFETTYGSEFCEKTDPAVFRRSQNIEQRAVVAAMRPKVASEESAAEFDPYRTTSSAYNGGFQPIQASATCTQRMNKYQTSDIRAQLSDIQAQYTKSQRAPRAEFAPSHAYGSEQEVTLRNSTVTLPSGVRDNVWAETHAMTRMGVDRTIGYDQSRRAHLETKANAAAQLAREAEDARLARYRVYKRSFGAY